jgi:hypothetical protein
LTFTDDPEVLRLLGGDADGLFVTSVETNANDDSIVTRGWRSTDDGATWVELPSPGALRVLELRGLSFADDGSALLIAGSIGADRVHVSEP